MPKSPVEIAKEEALEAFKKALPPAGLRFAARIGDAHLCPMVDGVKPHAGGPLMQGAPTVRICGQFAARVGDSATCAGPPDSIITGSTTVRICGSWAARFMDQTAHGGFITAGAATVIIGDRRNLPNGFILRPRPSNEVLSKWAQSDWQIGGVVTRALIAMELKRFGGRVRALENLMDHVVGDSGISIDTKMHTVYRMAWEDLSLQYAQQGYGFDENHRVVDSEGNVVDDPINRIQKDVDREAGIGRFDAPESGQWPTDDVGGSGE